MGHEMVAVARLSPGVPEKPSTSDRCKSDSNNTKSVLTDLSETKVGPT